jgi:hypothetical protein
MCEKRRAEEHLAKLRSLHGRYSSELDRKWHTIGEMDLIVELELLKAENGTLVKSQSTE